MEEVLCDGITPGQTPAVYLQHLYKVTHVALFILFIPADNKFLDKPHNYVISLFIYYLFSTKPVQTAHAQ